MSKILTQIHTPFISEIGQLNLYFNLCNRNFLESAFLSKETFD